MALSPSKTIFALTVLSALCWGLGPATAEFYRYTDESGQVYYVDDLTKVPPQFRQAVKTYREKYDHLPEEERLLMLQKDREIDALRKLQDRKMRESAFEDPQQTVSETDVVIMNDHVLVPVTIRSGNKEFEGLFMLDTGASRIVLYADLAEKLGLKPFAESLSQLAGGGVIATERAMLEYVAVGPLELADVEATIIEHTRSSERGRKFDGLLGMNILKNIQYTIDFDNKKIIWKQPS